MKALALLIPLAGCGTAPDASPAPNGTAMILQFDQLTVVNGRGRYIGQIGDQRATIDFAVPLNRVNPARGHGSDRVGATDDGVVVLIDRYATRTSDLDDRCAAEGREAWVRIFALASAKQLTAIPLESCRDGVPAADVVWEAPNHFRIDTRPARVYSIDGETLKAS